MSSVCPKSVLRDVLIGFGLGLVLMITLGVVTTASASSPQPPTVSGK